MANELQFVEYDARVIWDRMLAEFEGALGQTLASSDERRIFLQQELQVIVALYNAINFAGRVTLLRYAYDDYLDAIGEDRGVTRLAATQASTTLRFSLQEVRTHSVVIPAGTRAATADGQAVFYTETASAIPSGQLQADVPAKAVNAGIAGNGVAVGMASVLVDPIAYVYRVSNTTVSAGGADIENDDSYKERIRISEAQTSTAGATDSYKYWTATANPDIADVSVTSPSPATVLVVPLMADGQVPQQEVLAAVHTILSSKEVRPLTDQVQVDAPTIRTYTIDFDYYAPLAQAGIVRQAVEGEGGAVNQFTAWQRAQLDKALNPDYLRALLFEAGATRVVLRAPEYADAVEGAVLHENLDQRAINYIAE